MKYFFRVNAISILYALMVFFPVELMVNVYRINRLTNWRVDTVNLLTGVMILFEITAGSLLMISLTNKWLGRRKANYWTIVLWIPYFVLFLYIFASLFPITYGGDDPNPVTGLFIIGGLLAHPLYIFLLNLFVITADE
ncbi:hypothetical protein [Mesobacillus sp. S13]|uniref:hypothetical protein n=1 Tax=Mesobacillus sp. S13 TaxID=2880221 RepID=UPI001CF55B68|nr:hypothetical protein [Mesobacillus sp. S13]